MENSSSFFQLWQYAKPERPKIIIATCFSIVNMLLDIFPEILIGVAVNVVVKQEDSWIAHLGFPDVKTQLIILGAVTFTAWALESATEYCYSILWRNLAQTLQHNLRLDAYDHVQHLSMEYHEDISTGKLLSVLNDDINQLERFLDTGVNKFIQLITSTIAILAIFFYLAPTIALFVLIPVPFIFFTTFFFQRRLAVLYGTVREAAGQTAARIANNILGIVTIKSYTTQDYEWERICADSKAYKEANREAIKVSAAFIPVVRMVLALGFIAAILIGGWQVLDGKLDVGAYSLLVFQTQRFLWPFTELAEMLDLLARSMASASRVLDLIALPMRTPSGSQRLPIDQVKGHIVFDHVFFVYPNGSQVFDDLSLEILPGTTVAFVGATGSGKSSVIKLLLRFYDPTSGKILLDGHDISDLYLDDLRKAIGFVSQEVFLFHGTVSENIMYGTFHATMDDVIRAAKVAEAHEFIMELPQGYDTLIGERGQRLSGGQRQRISIARAVLKNPPIFVFDEATSAVDTETEAAIQRSLEKMVVGHTAIIIAHRLSTVRNADKIFVMEYGTIAESGTHDELVRKGGIYAALWRVQTGERKGS